MVGILLLCGLLLLLVHYLLKSNPLDAIPGPKAWPLIGNVHQLSVDKLFVQLSEMGKKYGGIYRLKLFTRSIVVVSDYGLIHDVLVKQSRDFAGRYNSYRGTIMKQSLSAIVSTDAGPELSARRKTVQAYVKQYGSGIQKIEDITQIAMDDLIRKFADVSGDRPIDVRDYMISTTLDIISILLVGEVAERRDRETLRETMDMVVDAVSPSNGMLLDIFPFVRHLGNNNYKQFQELIRRKDEFVNKWFGSQPNEGFIHFLQSMPEAEQRSKFLETLSPKGKVAFEFFLAGTFTTSTTTTVLMNVLCQYPEVQEKLRQEIFQVIGPSRYPTLKDQEAMPYLRATILEIGRFLTVAPLALPHKTMKTCQLDQYTIPEGVEVCYICIS
jgi:cytochrome P450